MEPSTTALFLYEKVKKFLRFKLLIWPIIFHWKSKISTVRWLIRKICEKIGKKIEWESRENGKFESDRVSENLLRSSFFSQIFKNEPENKSIDCSTIREFLFGSEFKNIQWKFFPI